MKSLLSPAGRRLLEELALGSTLVVLDYDGTLAPIAAEPARAYMREETRARLAAVAARWPVVVLSGREERDLGPFLRGTGVHAVVGNHGLEREPNPAERLERVGRWRRQLEGALSGDPGLRIEDKRHSLTVHYRGARDRGRARRRILASAGELAGARVQEAKEAFNLLPRDSSGKAGMLSRLHHEWRCDRVLFVGDDATDEEAFAAAGAGAVTVRVGPAPRTSAQWMLADQTEIDALLERLAELRAGERRWPR